MRYLHFEDRRISLKIIFLVLLPVGSRSLLGLASIHVVEFGIVWPWALFIVIPKLSLIGNYFLLKLKGSEISSDGDKGILGIKTRFPACCPFTISQSIALSSKAFTISRVPLHSPWWGSRFQRSMTE